MWHPALAFHLRMLCLQMPYALMHQLMVAGAGGAALLADDMLSHAFGGYPRAAELGLRTPLTFGSHAASSPNGWLSLPGLFCLRAPYPRAVT